MPWSIRELKVTAHIFDLNQRQFLPNMFMMVADKRFDDDR
jgi:hypothetical protein